MERLFYLTEDENSIYGNASICGGYVGDTDFACV